MPAKSKSFLIIFAGAALVLGILIVATALTVFHWGILTVEVHERGGDDVNIRCPGFIVPAVMAFLPDDSFVKARDHLSKVPPNLHESIRTLAHIPDCVLIDVFDKGEHVTVAKRHASLVVDVDAPDEKVHLSIPIATLGSVFEKIQEAADKARRESVVTRGDHRMSVIIELA